MQIGILHFFLRRDWQHHQQQQEFTDIILIQRGTGLRSHCLFHNVVYHSGARALGSSPLLWVWLLESRASLEEAQLQAVPFPLIF